MRGGRHRGGRGRQPARAQAALAVAGRRAGELRRRPDGLPGRAADEYPAPVPLLRRRPVPADLPAVRGRAADLHLVADARRGPAQRDRRPDADRGAGPALVDLPGFPVRARLRFVRAAEGRRDRLPARRRARAGHAGPDARAGNGTVPVRPILLMLASLIAPVVLFVQSFRFRGGDLGVIAVFSAILYLLVLSRLSD